MEAGFHRINPHESVRMTPIRLTAA